MDALKRAKQTKFIKIQTVGTSKNWVKHKMAAQSVKKGISNKVNTKRIDSQTWSLKQIAILVFETETC